jgi:hypothetical protein
MSKKAALNPAPARIVSLVFLFTFMFYAHLSAYLDPGTGSYMLQLLIAGLASAFLAVKIFWNNIVLFFKKVFKNGKKGGK